MTTILGVLAFAALFAVFAALAPVLARKRCAGDGTGGCAGCDGGSCPSSRENMKTGSTTNGVEA